MSKPSFTHNPTWREWYPVLESVSVPAVMVSALSKLDNDPDTRGYIATAVLESSQCMVPVSSILSLCKRFELLDSCLRDFMRGIHGTEGDGDKVRASIRQRLEKLEHDMEQVEK